VCVHTTEFGIARCRDDGDRRGEGERKKKESMISVSLLGIGL
jgi:hypothetical protein